MWQFVPAIAAPTLPATELEWKNVLNNGRVSATHSFLCDSKGLIWVGTNNGLCFYDGISCRLVDNPRLMMAQVYAMVEHGDYLLLGTNHGLMRFDRNNGEVEILSGLAHREIRCMMLVDDRLWVGSLYGVNIINLRNMTSEATSEGLPHQSVYCLLRDSRGVIYAGTFDGLARWDAVKKSFSNVDSTNSGHARQNLFVNCLLESVDGSSLYVGSEGSLYRYHVGSERWERIADMEGNNVKCLASLEDGHVLIGTDDGIFDMQRDTIRHYRHDSRLSQTLADNEIWCLLIDGDRNVWAGHEKGFSISSLSDKFRTLRLSSLANSGEGNEIYAMLRDSRGALWLGGTNGVLQLSDENGCQWYRHSNISGSLSHNRVRSINEDSSGHVWLSTDGGLNRYNPVKSGFDVFLVSDSLGKHNTNWAYAMAEDTQSLWVGGFLGGLHRVAKSKLTGNGGPVYSDLSLNSTASCPVAESCLLENDLVSHIEIDRHGHIWLLLFGENILNCYLPEKGILNKYDIPGLCGNSPSKMLKDSRGRIWCAFNGGVIVFSDDGAPTVLKYAPPTEDESVIAMGRVGDDMWISSQSNLWRVSAGVDSAMILPIPHKPYTAIYEDPLTGNVILGGIDEILEINPSNLEGLSGHSGIKLMAVEVGGRMLSGYDLESAGHPIEIPYGGNISFIVSSLDYSPTAVHRYMYKIADSPADSVGGWAILPEGTNNILLSDLRMGSYEMLVKRLGTNASVLSVPLKVMSPGYLSWWAIVIYVLCGVGIVYGVVVYMHERNKRVIMENERRQALDNVEKKLIFLSNISHDLKTPLSMILGPVSLMKEQTKDASTRKTLEIVYSNAVKLNDMIHKTMELQQLENATDGMLILSTFDVVEFCRGVFETFKDSHPQRNFIFHAESQAIFIEADAVKFESVMANLLSNACKYSEDGSTITCGISTRGGNAEIVVSDDGLGIDETDQPLVFQRMFRSPDVVRLKEGTGLGLYLIKQYLDLMNGNIDLYSRKGQGTSFTITLPLSDKVAEKTDVSNKSGEGDRPKILIVEDNMEISAFIAAFLGKDHEVLVAENGRSGLAIASSFQPDLIIVDEMMPIMTGLEMCRRLKQIPRLQSVPVIMLTAKSDNVTENESVKLGIDAFMQKPFEPNVLLGRVRQLLNYRKEISDRVRIQTITEAKPIEAESSTEKLLAKIARIIEDNVSDPDLNVKLLCEKSGMQQKQLYRVVKKHIGTSPLDYIRRVRLQKAAMLLEQKRFTVAEISYMVGFMTPSYFSKCFQAQYGVKPSQYTGDISQ